MESVRTGRRAEWGRRIACRKNRILPDTAAVPARFRPCSENAGEEMAARRDDTTINWAGTGPGWGISIAFNLDSIATNTAAVPARFRPCLESIGRGMAARQCGTTTTDWADTGPGPGSSIVFSPGSITITTAELDGFRPCWVTLANVDGDGMAATSYPHRRPVSGHRVAVRRTHIGRIRLKAAEPARFRPSLKAAWLAGREGGKPAVAFYPGRTAAVGRWVTIRGINIKKMKIGRIKENTAAVPARFRPYLKTPVLARGSHLAARFYAVRRPAVGRWVTTRGMSIKKRYIGRTEEKTAAVKVNFRPSLEAAGLTIGSGKKSDRTVAWKAGTGVVPGHCIGRIRVRIRSSTGRIT